MVFNSKQVKYSDITDLPLVRWIGLVWNVCVVEVNIVTCSFCTLTQIPGIFNKTVSHLAHFFETDLGRDILFGSPKDSIFYSIARFFYQTAILCCHI